MKLFAALRTGFWVWLTKKSPSVFYHPLAYPEWERMQQDHHRRQEQAHLTSLKAADAKASRPAAAALAPAR